ncbi:VOC family protein [Heyndrickxia faecalis]|uniref:VOC family protein n=1 Tax=Heyndrickxia faecalis TaxID=2824910 RepID=UPI003D192F9C
MAFNFIAIDHVQLAAPRGSEQTAKKFYAEILGFTEIEKPPELKKRGGCWFQNGKIQIHIGIEEPFLPAKKAHPAFEVRNLESLKERFTHYQMKWTEDGKLPGAARVYATDPFGNRLEFLEWKSK